MNHIRTQNIDALMDEQYRESLFYLLDAWEENLLNAVKPHQGDGRSEIDSKIDKALLDFKESVDQLRQAIAQKEGESLRELSDRIIDRLFDFLRKTAEQSGNELVLEQLDMMAQGVPISEIIEKPAKPKVFH